MKTLIQLSVFYVLIGIISCNNDGASSKSSHREEDNKKGVSLRQFLKKFRTLTLPLNIQVSGEPPKDVSKAQSKSVDTLFIKTVDGSNNSSICYGVLPDTSQYFMLIWEYPANLYVPMLTIFAKDGSKLSEQVISVGDCAGNEVVAGSGVSTNCVNSVLIGEDYSIFSSDTIATSKCDAGGNIIPNTTHTQLKYMSGRIKKDGKIEFDKPEQKKIQ